ncbi:MAG: TonB family protein [Kiritimatiellia bacterium]
MQLYSPKIEQTPEEEEQEKRVLKRRLLYSGIFHVVLLTAIVVASVATFRKPEQKEIDILTDFTVAVPPMEEEKKPEENPAKNEQPKVEEAPKPDPDLLPEEKKPPKKKREIQISKKIVERKPEKRERVIVKPPETSKIKNREIKRSIDIKGPKLTDDEIRKLMERGARPAETTSIPATENERCLVLIRDQLYNAWIRPDTSAIGQRAPVIEISIGAGGVIRDVRLQTSSGNPVLDQSVLSAARAVRSFRHLTDRFIRANPTVTVNFELKG